jgi:hypothetical protein
LTPPASEKTRARTTARIHPAMLVISGVASTPYVAFYLKTVK